MAFVTPVVEHWLEREISQWVHTMKDRSALTMELHLAPDLCNKGNKGHSVCYPVCGIVHIKEPLLLIKKNSPCSVAAGFLSI